MTGISSLFSGSKIERRIKYSTMVICAALLVLGMIAGMPGGNSDEHASLKVLQPNRSARDNDRKPKPCGLSGSIAERIADCDESRVTRGGWVWRLVTRTASGSEVWMEPVDSVIWGEALRTVEPAMKGLMTYSRSLSACRCDLDENGRIYSMTWVLPTSEDYDRANSMGMREVLPNISEEFWTETSYYVPRTWRNISQFSPRPNRADTYDGRDGLVWRDYPERLHRVRCIGWR